MWLEYVPDKTFYRLKKKCLYCNFPFFIGWHTCHVSYLQEADIYWCSFLSVRPMGGNQLFPRVCTCRYPTAVSLHRIHILRLTFFSNHIILFALTVPTPKREHKWSQWMFFPSGRVCGSSRQQRVQAIWQ